MDQQAQRREKYGMLCPQLLRDTIVDVCKPDLARDHDIAQVCDGLKLI